MADTVASSSTAASSNKFYHVFINHHGPDVKKTFASHLYHRLCSAGTGLRVFLDQPELRAGRNFDCQIKDAIRTATVHVAIFSPRYAESEWCLNELLYMLESRALIIPVFYHVDPAVVRWPQGKGVYAEALRILENKKTQDPQTHEERPRHDPATIKKWREALSTASIISGFDLNAAPFNGDEGALVEKIVQRVLEEIKSRSSLFSCSFSMRCCNMFRKAV